MIAKGKWAMIMVHKGNTKDSKTFRLILSCDQCRMHVVTDVPLQTLRAQDDTVTEHYLDGARAELAQICTHMQEELRHKTAEAQPSSQEGWSVPLRRPSSYSNL